jgi:hypothetical protein
MKTKLGALVLALVLMLAMIPAVGAQGPAYQTAFTTSITYQNVSNANSSIQIDFYAENSGTVIPITQPDLAGGAGASIFVGSINTINPSFRGSAVLSSSQRIVATLVQVPQGNAAVKNRPLSNGFEGDDGSTTFLVPTTLKERFATNTVFSIQNVDTGPVNLTVTFYNADAGGAEAHVETHNNLPAGAAKYYDLGLIGALPSNFNGSAVVEATGSVVASAMELSTNGAGASAFEGVPSGATTVYMATALCQTFGGTSSYAVQNTSNSATANVTVTYKPGDFTATAAIGPGAKASFVACQASGVTPGFTGSAVITSDQPIVAIGKVFPDGPAPRPYSTAFAGETAGADTIALPYVRYTADATYNNGSRQRVFLAIQNVGPSTVNGVTVSYRNSSGVQLCSQTIASIEAGAKANSNPFTTDNPAACAEFGYNADGTFGGAAIITGPDGSELVAIARVQSINTSGQAVAEDYNGTAIE